MGSHFAKQGAHQLEAETELIFLLKIILMFSYITQLLVLLKKLKMLLFTAVTILDVHHTNCGASTTVSLMIVLQYA